MSEAWRIMDQMVKLVREGRVLDARIEDVLTGIKLTVKGNVGVFSKGMLKTASGNMTLDPMNISDFCVSAESEPEPEPEPKSLGASNHLGFEQEI